LVAGGKRFWLVKVLQNAFSIIFKEKFSFHKFRASKLPSSAGNLQHSAQG
jgi:hypothetical protein